MRATAAKIVSLVLLISIPATFTFAETTAAMAYGSGQVQVNGSGMPKSSAIFRGDALRTAADSAVTLNAEGSTVLVAANSSLVYRGDAVELDSGTAVVNTSKGMKAQVQALTVAPASQGTAKFEVTRSNGKVLVAALKGAVTVSDGSSSVMVPQGSTTTQEEQKESKRRPAGAWVPGHTMSNAVAIGIGTAAAAAAAIIAITTTGRPEASPSTP